MKSITTLIFIIFFSCNSPSDFKGEQGHTTDMKQTYYADINLYELKGLLPLQEVAYPSITIKDSIFRKNIVFHIDRDHSFSKEYVKLDSMWVCVYDFKADTSWIYAYEIIFNNKILSFNYADSNSCILRDASIFEDSTNIIYNPVPGFCVEPKVENFESVPKNSESKYVQEFNTSNNVFIRTGKRVDREGKVQSSIITCYPKNNRSIFWWMFFCGYPERN